MVFVLGVILFAVGLLASVAWHECGHMWAAQLTGMKVRRYFVGFGPTLWSTHRGGIEYGVKAIPLGGFCDIAGMTTHDEISDEDAPRAMYKQAVWRRLVVLFAGPLMNFILGFVLIVVLAVGWGLPSMASSLPAKVGYLSCVPSSISADGVAAPCSGKSPAELAGVKLGDTIVEANGTSVSSTTELTKILRVANGPVTLKAKRDKDFLNFIVNPSKISIATKQSDGSVTTETISRIGIGYDSGFKKHTLISAVPAAAIFTGDLLGKTWDSLLSMPSKVSALWRAVTGGEREQDTPTSVVGASVIGGQAADHGEWGFFLFLLISLNFFLGLFNLVPLLPLDGGHMAVALFEKGRNIIRGWRGLGPAAPVDYLKLMPFTYAVMAVLGVYMLLTLSADIINPIKVF